MPIRKVKGGYKFGVHGKTYKKRSDAVRQMKAIFAHGYKEQPTKKRKKRR